MAMRALLIGSQTGGLSGVHNDVNAVADRLAGWGFATELCTGQAATRRGILERYVDLIEKTATGDPVVVYYSGHGGLAANPDYQPMTAEGVVVPRYYQFIVPADIEETTEEDFRGITSLELSALLARLTKKTKNATVILDCCHAARMSRDLDLMPRAWPRPWFVGIAGHLKRLASQGISLDAVDVESNPDAVRLVAAAPDESAYEYTNATGQRVGLLTESFLIALEEAKGQKVSWRSLGTRVRERVLSVVPYQRPEIEGPADRLLFDVDTVELTGVLPVIVREGEPMLQGGRLLGVHVGDEYAIAPMGVEKAAPENQIARATVESVAGAVSKIRIEPEHAAIPQGANAFPLSTTLPRRPVRINAAGEERRKLVEAINDSQHVRVAAEEDPAEVLAEVAAAQGQIDLRDPSGLSLVEPKLYSDENVLVTASNLDRFARVQAVLNLRSGEGENALATPYQVEWGRVVEGKPQPLAHVGDLVSVGDPVYVRVANAGQAKIYFSLFDMGLAGKITLLTRSQPSGVGLLPGEDYVFGHKEGVGLTGVNLGWAAGVPRDTPRRESLLVISSDRPQDLRALEAEGMRGIKGPRTSPLQEMMEQIAWGGTRDLAAEGQPDPDVRYAVSRIDFQVAPNPAPAQDKGAFLMDDRPEPSFLLRMPEAKGEAPSTVAIRLKDLIVHRNRALASTEIRLDVLVVTGPSSGSAGKAYEMKTANFPGIKDGDRLPFDNLLVYYGPVAHFLDMAVWVSRDQKDSLSLAELFKTELNSTEFKTAAAVLAGLAVAAPQAALVVGALGASATLVNIGTKLLLQAVGKSVGLYRTSHLAFERFGEGRHPANGLMVAQDFSFGYEIVAVE
jgi:hypothetical protein